MLPWLISAALMLMLAALATRFKRQAQRIRVLEESLAQASRTAEARLDADTLTGLSSRAALERRISEDKHFPGVVVVIDLDNFKALNDSLGHLAGDEILHNIGRLIHSSIRQEDTAFRWGGDEFVILFHNLDEQVADLRMLDLAERLERFHLRNKGPLAIHFSWGTAPTAGRSLRESLDVADRIMLGSKRARGH
jgi:diguanylate cyclase (GGDEF)-like protein